MSNFIRFGKFGGKISINFAAFLFPHLYFLFRKMNLVGIIMLVATALLNIPTAIEYLSAGTMGFSLDIGIDVTGRVFQGISAATWYVSMALQFVAGFFGNYMYYKFAQKKIREIRSEDGTEQEIAEKDSSQGRHIMGGCYSWLCRLFCDSCVWHFWCYKDICMILQKVHKKMQVTLDR